MPYKNMKDVNSSIKGIKPSVTLEQANKIAAMADAIDPESVESPWAVAISNFKKAYEVKDGKWTKKSKDNSEEAEASEQEPPSTCVCPSCGETTEKKRGEPCRSVSCPSCGETMIAKTDDDESKENKTEELDQSLSQISERIRGAFSKKFSKISQDETAEVFYPWIKDIYMEHPEFKNSIIVELNGDLYLIEYEIDNDNIQFAERDLWRKVKQSYSMQENFENIVTIKVDDGRVPLSDLISAWKQVQEAETQDPQKTQESEKPEKQESAQILLKRALSILENENNNQESENSDAAFLEGSFGELSFKGRESDESPVIVEVALITPGWGNKRDNNYYSREMLEKNAKKFEGAKMYATDHREHEKSVITEVSQILECPIGFTPEGGPIAKVGIFDPIFAESVKNRAKLGKLQDLACSILASGRVRPGFEQDGRKGQYVESITSVSSVDWVTKAGAGGRALSLAETEDEMKGKKKTDASVETSTKEVEEKEQESREAPLHEQDEQQKNAEENKQDNSEETEQDKEQDKEPGSKEAETETESDVPAEDEESDSDEQEGDESEPKEETDDEQEEGESEEKPEGEDESEPKKESQESAVLTDDEIKNALSETELPNAAQKRLLKRSYTDKQALQEAIELEREYIQAIAGPGRVSLLGEKMARRESKRKTLKEKVARQNAERDKVLGKHGF